MNYANQAFTAGSIAGAGNVTQDKQVGQLESIESQLHWSLAAIHDLQARTRMLTDRLLGPQPEAVGDGKAVPTPSSVVHRLDTTAAYIRESLSDLSAVMSRLERL